MYTNAKFEKPSICITGVKGIFRSIAVEERPNVSCIPNTKSCFFLYVQNDFKVKPRKNSEHRPTHQCQTDIHHKENVKLLLIMPITVLSIFF